MLELATMSEDTDDRAGFIPPEQRKNDAAPLDISSLEYLDRLVELGEGLLYSECFFYQAEALLRTGHAEVLRVYPVQDHYEGTTLKTIRSIRLIVPTELGKTLAAIRERMKLEKMKEPAKPFLQAVNLSNGATAEARCTCGKSQTAYTTEGCQKKGCPWKT